MGLSDAQQAEHLEVMTEICHYFNRKGMPMVLKGGTALKLCYGLDRFSEDLDFVDKLLFLRVPVSVGGDVNTEGFFCRGRMEATKDFLVGPGFVLGEYLGIILRRQPVLPLFSVPVKDDEVPKAFAGD